MCFVRACFSKRQWLLTAFAIFAAPSSASYAADLGGNCCADLEERIAELEATTGRKGNRAISLTLTGFVGGQPKYVVIDPTSFALEDNALRFIGAGITNVLSGTLDGTIATAPLAPAGQMNLGAVPPGAVSNDDASGLAPSAASAVWGAGLGGRVRFDETDDTTESEETFGGGIGGAHFRLAPGVVAGAFAGGASNRLETDRGKNIDTDYVLAGFYGRLLAGQMFVEGSTTGGWSDSNSERQMVVFLPGAVRFETAQADYESAFFMPALRFGANIPVGNGAILVPAAQVRYILQHFDGYQESGSSANLTVGDRTLQSFEERFELGIRQTIGLEAGQNLTVHANAGVSLYQRVGDRDVDVGVFGTAASLDPGAESTETGVFGRAGFDWQITSTVSAFGEAEGLHTEDADAVTGTGGVRVRF